MATYADPLTLSLYMDPSVNPCVFDGEIFLLRLRGKRRQRNGCVSISGLLDSRFAARALMEFAPMLLIVESASGADRLIRFCDGEVARLLPSDTVCFAFRRWD